MEINNIEHGDCIDILKTYPDESINCIITSPPYWGLRDYGVNNQLGLEESLWEYLEKLCNIFDECKRILRNDGTCWVNIGDTYASYGSIEDRFYHGSNHGKHRMGGDGNLSKGYSGRCRTSEVKAKSLCQIPARFAIEMTNRGWLLRNEIIWHKLNVMPSSAHDRFTVDYEKVFFFVKNKKYWFEKQYEKYTHPLDRWGGVYTDGNVPNSKYFNEGNNPSALTKRARNFRPNESGRNKRCVWEVNTKPYSGAHFATFPEKLIRPMILAGCPEGGIVLDPFMGAGTTALVALKEQRQYVGIELNPKYIEIAEKRLRPVKEQEQMI